MRSWRCIFLLAMSPALWACPSRGEEVASPAEHPVTAAPFVEITPQSRQSIERGLAYLARAQADDGSYGAEQYGRHAGITALACLAFMADGHLPGRGAYGIHVDRGLQFIIACEQETGLVAADTSHGPMYGHGFATLFLGEIYGMTGDNRVREALIKATRLIVDNQNREGGWRYNPVPYDADISVTICQIMALRSARNAGIHVPRETIDRAIQYVRQCQNPVDGGFRYMLNSGGSAFPRSAAGVASLYYAGVYHDDALRRGLEYLLANRPAPNSRAVGHYFYGHYYAAQATFLAGGDYWKQWYPATRDELIAQQQDNGGWDSAHGPSYGTAMALLVLEVPNRLLPIFQR
ncbi:MAG: terpene cyclase/mutase family protein [Phycisphaeraceae bacterium]|nr:terpene cyclase/mutase family protein [Phycisphaeraceae bacterium]